MALISIGTLIFYDNGWRELTRLPVSAAYHLRFLVIVTVLLISVAAVLIAALLPGGRFLRALVSGLLTGLALHYLSGWVGDHYLGGYAHPDPRAIGMLMLEGQGIIMYAIVTPLIGILAFIRAEFE